VTVSRPTAWLTGLALAAVAVTAAVRWRRPASSPAPPAIQYYREIDLGEHDFGDIVTTAFRVTNTGGAPLELSRFSSSCSCAGVEAEQDGESRRVESVRIPPGEHFDLTVRVAVGANPANSQHVEVVFATNDPAHPAGRVQFIVPRVRGLAYLAPNAVIFGAVPPGRPASQRVDVYDNGSAAREIDYVRSLKPDRFRARIVPVPDTERPAPHAFAGRLIARIEVVAITDAAGPLDGDIEVGFRGVKQTRQWVAVTGAVRADAAARLPLAPHAWADWSPAAAVRR
jgi:hypothetical protein